MATREKKLSLGRKQNTSSPQPPKEDPPPTPEVKPTNDTAAAPEEAAATPKNATASSTTTTTTPKTSLPKRLSKSPPTPKKLTKKASIAIKLKPTMKKNAKIKQKMMKAMMSNAKNAETKKKLLKTCVKQIKPKKAKVVKSDIKEENLPPVLEPILPIEEELENKQKKKTGRPPKIDNYKKVMDLDQARARRVYKRRAKETPPPSDTIEEVMNDLNTLIKSGSTEEETPKKVVVVRKRRTTKENIENTLCKLSPSERKVIDMLDLNVSKFKGLPVAKRRHSIEKFPISNESDTGLNRLSVLNNLPRCMSPRSKNFPKVRLDGLRPRSNPYKMRSDSPARILRNGKQRKLRDLELLDGLDITTHKRRRRNCSEFSGSEISFSKSGYESDSSFSDMSSLHGGVDTSETKDVDGIKSETKENFEPPLEELEEVKIKRSPSTEEAEANFDTNDNVCKEQVKAEEATSDKVPEKSIILDIMKQTFNDTFDDKKAVEEKLPQHKHEEEEAEKDQQEEEEEEVEEGGVVNGDASVMDKPDVVDPVNGATTTEQETPEDLAIKENILQALGLQSLKAAKEAKLKSKEKQQQQQQQQELRPDFYTGTLKTVIKINRATDGKKKGRNSMKMTLHKNKKTIDLDGMDDCCRPTKDGPSTSWKHGGQSSDTAGAHRKSHYSNRSNMDGSSEHTSDGENGTQEGSTKALVIPEKASSFSIHPGRICKDECSYCYGKFGLFDTPCHIAQMKSVDRQNKILAAEKHLTRDSCLCDACYRHVDRKANTPSYANKSYKRSALVAPTPRQDHCHVLGCRKVASNILRRKWIIKMRRSICEVINIDLDNPGLHSIPICDEHYSALEYLMVCAMCKRRLAKNHVHYLGPETVDLNAALDAEGIPLTLSDKPVVCKLCKYFAAIILKPVEERPENSSTFFMEYKKRLLHFNDIVPMDEAAAEEPIIIPSKDKLEPGQLRKKRKLSKNQIDGEENDKVPSSDSTNQSRPESPSDYMVDYNTLIPSIAMECGSDSESKKEPKPAKKIPRPESVKQAVEISKTMKLKSDKSSEIAVQRLGSNPSISVRQLFPCEEDLPLQGHVEFGNVKERTPEGWEKCTSIIQYDMETKHLWQELQKPYGNQSSFLRHLILLEKYFRNGDLVLAPNASHHSINYSESVHNRLRAYDNIPSTAGNVQPISMLPFNKKTPIVVTTITTSATTAATTTTTTTNTTTKEVVVNAASLPKSTPITISQLNSPPLIPAAKPKAPPGAPPGLISLHPGTTRPMAPLVKVPQSQKIKFPITKNWRPNLIPIDPTKRSTERKAGLVQVISGGKPYHITLEDYKKMCAIKKSFELKQKRLQEAQKQQQQQKGGGGNGNGNSVLKAMVPRKGLVISKAIGNNTASVATATTSPKQEVAEVMTESFLEKLDKQVEKLEPRLSENKPPLSLPKIPKSLTVIPQTVTRKPSRPSSPVLLITPKPKQITNKS